MHDFPPSPSRSSDLLAEAALQQIFAKHPLCARHVRGTEAGAANRTATSWLSQSLGYHLDRHTARQGVRNVMKQNQAESGEM